MAGRLNRSQSLLHHYLKRLKHNIYVHLWYLKVNAYSPLSASSVVLTFISSSPLGYFINIFNICSIICYNRICDNSRFVVLCCGLLLDECITSFGMLSGTDMKQSCDCPSATDSSLMHYSDVMMGAMASQITSLTIVYSTVYLSLDQRKHQSSASLAFVRWIHRDR